MNEFLIDMRGAFRALWRRPLFTLAATCSIALGLGAMTAVLSLMHSALWAPLPFPDAGRLIRVWATEQREDPDEEFSYQNFLDIRAQTSAFETMAAVGRVRMVIIGEERAERLRGEAVTDEYFRILGLKPLLGRLPTPDNFNRTSPPTALINHRIWKSRYGSRKDIVGEILRSTNAAFEIIGVMPPNFLGTTDQDIVDFWTPVQTWVQYEYRRDRFLEDRSLKWMRLLGRLKRTSEIDHARTELETIAARLETQFPDANQGRGVRLEPFSESWRRVVRPGLLLLLAGSAFILLIGSANVANLLLGRTVDRRREFALRAALGAGRWRLFRQLMTENLVLAVLGGAGGMLLSFWLTGTLVQSSLSNLPDYVQIPGYVSFGVQWQSYLVGVALTLLVSLSFGLAPVLLSLRTDLVETLKAGSRGSGDLPSRQAIGSALVAAEVALVTVLLVTSGLLLRSYYVLQGTDLGFRTDHILKMQVTLNPQEYSEDHTRLRYYEEVIERIENTPGVRKAAVLSPTLPMLSPWTAPVRMEGAPLPPASQELRANLHFTSAGLFDVLDIPVIEGRGFESPDDRDGRPVAIVSLSLARRIAPDGDAVGRRIITPGPGQRDRVITIVGVVNDVLFTGPTKLRGSNLDWYIPMAQNPGTSAGIAVWTSVEPESLAGTLRVKVEAINPSVPVHWIETMESSVATESGPTRSHTQGVGFFATIALALTVIGIYGVLAYRVSQRTQEFGIRMALGAAKMDILTMVLHRGMKLVGIGLVAGLAGAYAMSRLMASLLYGVTPTDPFTLGAVGMGVLLVSAAACYLPARRAARVDPMEALRAD